MKKIISLLFLSVFALFLVSCDTDDDNNNYTDNDTYPQVVDITENFKNSDGANADYLYGINKTFASPLYNTDVILIYRRDSSSGTAVWKLLPKTYYFGSTNALDYTFDFTVNDVQIYADANFNLTAQDSSFKNTYLNNQTFRVVFIPASGKGVDIDYNDYNAVIQGFNIDDSKVKKL